MIFIFGKILNFKWLSNYGINMEAISNLLMLFIDKILTKLGFSF